MLYRDRFKIKSQRLWMQTLITGIHFKVIWNPFLVLFRLIFKFVNVILRPCPCMWPKLLRFLKICIYVDVPETQVWIKRGQFLNIILLLILKFQGFLFRALFWFSILTADWPISCCKYKTIENALSSESFTRSL